MTEELRALLRTVYYALDTAEGVCQLVADGVKPRDLRDCAGEIANAKGLVDQALRGMTQHATPHEASDAAR
jgi:hypothetical protein